MDIDYLRILVLDLLFGVFVGVCFYYDYCWFPVLRIRCFGFDWLFAVCGCFWDVVLLDCVYLLFGRLLFVLLSGWCFIVVMFCDSMLAFLNFAVVDIVLSDCLGVIVVGYFVFVWYWLLCILIVGWAKGFSWLNV